MRQVVAWFVLITLVAFFITGALIVFLIVWYIL